MNNSTSTPTYSESAHGVRITLVRCALELLNHGIVWDDIVEFKQTVWQPLATIEAGDEGVRKIDAKHLFDWLGY